MEISLKDFTSDKSCSTSLGTSALDDRKFHESNGKQDGTHYFCASPASYSESIPSSNSASARAGENKKRNFAGDPSFSPCDKIKSLGGNNDKVVNLELGSSSRSGADGISTPSSRSRNNFESESGTGKNHHVHIKKAIGRSDVKNRGREPSLPDSVSFTLSESTCYRDRIRDRFNTVKERALESVSRPRSQPRLKMILMKQTGGRIEDLLRKEEEELNAAITRHKNVKTLWTDASDATVEAKAQEESFKFFTRLYGDESPERENESPRMAENVGNAEDAENVENLENSDPDGKILASELLGMRSDSELCQFKTPQILKIDREKEKNILFCPTNEPVALDEKVESGLAPRLLEQEGIYVGKRIRLPRKMKNKMEQRLLINQDGKKWFGINGEIETGAIPVSSVRMRANETETNAAFVFYEPPVPVHQRNQPVDLTRNTHYVLDVDIALIQFTHHPLFSREHVLAQRLKELLFKYRRRTEINSASRFKGRLEALRRTRDNAVAIARAAGDDHRHLLILLQRYEDDIKEVRKVRNREGQTDKELIHKILMTWKDLKQMREVQGYRNTDIKLHIKKTVPKDVEAEKKVWEEEIKREAKEIYNELKREYEDESAVRRSAREQRKKARTERIGDGSSGSDESDTEEPLPPKTPDLADIRDRVSEYFRKSFRHPGEPQVDFAVGVTDDEDYNAQDNREHQRRSAVKRQNIFLKLFYNGKEVCRSKSQPLSPDFKVFISQRFAIRILEWPESLMIEIHEDSGKFSKNLIVSGIFLPLPGCFTTVENSDVQKQEFSGSVSASYNHAGVGSGSDIVPYPDGSDYNNRPTCLLTSGTLAYRIGWAENRGRILSLPEKYWFATREETAVLGEMNASDGPFNISNLKEWIKKSNVDPNDPHNSAFFHFLQQAKDSESTDICYFRLDPLINEFEFCPEKEIADNKRLKLLKLRDAGELEFRGMRMIPLKENQIQKDVFRAYERRISTPKQSLEISVSDQLDGHRIWGRKYLRQMQERVLKEYRLARQHKNIHDLVTEESVPDLGTLGLTFMKWLRPKRPLRPVRKERKRITPQNLTGQDVKIIVNVVRAFEVPVRKDVDGLSSSASDPQTFSLVNVRPFVEVSFRGTKARTTAADGANPTWNQDLQIPLYAKNGDLSHAGLHSVKDKLYLHLFDEIVVDLIEDDIQRETSIHQRFERHWLASMEIPFSTLYFNSKIEGTFKLYSPPVLLGYEREAHRRQFSGSTGQEPLLPQRDATYISLFITVQPPLNPPDLLKEKLESSETSALEKHLEGWKNEIADLYSHRKIKPLVMDISGKTVCITRFIKALEPPRLTENGETTPEMAARYVAMIPSAAATTIFRGLFDIWLSADNVLRLLTGDSEDHALLLCSYFLHLGLQAFVLLGIGIPHGSAAYVFVKENSNKSNKYFVWDATTGQKFNINDSFCPLKKIYCLFNNENIWANIQPEEIPRRTRFDLSKRNDWFPAFGKNFAAPAGTVQPERLDYRTTSRQAVDILQDKMEKKLRDSVMKWRKSKRTRWNRYCSGTLRKFLPKLEESILSSKEGQTPDHLLELQHILASHKMCGFPINMPYTDMEAVVEAVKATGVHSNESEQVEFALSVYIHPYPNDVLSVWIYVASLVRRR